MRGRRAGSLKAVVEHVEGLAQISPSLDDRGVEIGGLDRRSEPLPVVGELANQRLEQFPTSAAAHERGQRRRAVGRHQQSDAQPPGHPPRHGLARSPEELPAVDAGQATSRSAPERPEDGKPVAPAPQSGSHHRSRLRSDGLRKMEQEGRLPAAVRTFDRPRATDVGEPCDERWKIVEHPTAVAWHEPGRRDVSRRERIASKVGMVDGHGVVSGRGLTAGPTGEHVRR